MEFSEVVRQRRMVRAYDDRAVDPATVERCLSHAQRAPSAGFSQGWGFLVLDEPASVAAYWAASTDPGADPATGNAWLAGMRTAPVLVLPCASKAAYLDRYALPDKGWTDRDETRWAMPYWYLDTAMAALLILQTAVDEGLGACFFGIPPARAAGVRATFGIPEDHEPIGAITLGHPSTGGAPGSPARRERRTDVVHRNHWA